MVPQASRLHLSASRTSPRIHANGPPRPVADARAAGNSGSSSFNVWWASWMSLTESATHPPHRPVRLDSHLAIARRQRSSVPLQAADLRMNLPADQRGSEDNQRRPALEARGIGEWKPAFHALIWKLNSAGARFPLQGSGSPQKQSDHRRIAQPQQRRSGSSASPSAQVRR